MHPASCQLGLTIVLKAFVDGSDPRENVPVAVVAGFVSNVATWESFEAQWNPLMKELGLARWHAADFRNRKGQYANWPSAQFLYSKGQVLKTLNSCQLLGVGCAVDINVFNDWRVTCGYYVHPDPYYFCLEKVLSKLIRGISEPVDEGVDIYCDRDQGREHLGKDIAQWHESRLRRLPYDMPVGPSRGRSVSTHYVSSFDFKPVQAADVLANDTYVCMKDFIRTNKFEEPEFIAGMKEKCLIMMDYFHDKELIEIDARSKLRRDEV
jgi:hypothetical protein